MPGFDPADLVHGQAVPKVILRNVAVLTPAESSQDFSLTDHKV